MIPVEISKRKTALTSKKSNTCMAGKAFGKLAEIDFITRRIKQITVKEYFSPLPRRTISVTRKRNGDNGGSRGARRAFCFLVGMASNLFRMRIGTVSIGIE
jgi:hypothetical protein